MAKMTSRERVLTALNLGIPDKVPFMESKVDYAMQRLIMGTDNFTPPQLAEKLGMDAFGFVGFLPPVFANTKVIDGRENILDGLVTSPDKLDLMVFPDPDEMAEEAKSFLKQYRGDHAVFATIRLGIAPTIWSMGIEAFSYAIFENPEFLRAVLRKYADFAAQAIERIEQLGFDFIWAADDIAYRSGPMFSPRVFRSIVISELKAATDKISIPWIYHSDGNLMPVLDDLITHLKPNAIHPIDPGSMDLAEVKRLYGSRVCLVGNIDLNYTLTRGTPAEVEQEVKEKIKVAAPGGGYIISSANSLTAYCKLENVLAMKEAIEKYRDYPIEV